MTKHKFLVVLTDCPGPYGVHEYHDIYLDENDPMKAQEIGLSKSNYAKGTTVSVDRCLYRGEFEE